MKKYQKDKTAKLTESIMKDIKFVVPDMPEHAFHIIYAVIYQKLNAVKEPKGKTKDPFADGVKRTAAGARDRAADADAVG